MARVMLWWSTIVWLLLTATASFGVKPEHAALDPGWLLAVDVADYSMMVETECTLASGEVLPSYAVLMPGDILLDGEATNTGDVPAVFAGPHGAEYIVQPGYTIKVSNDLGTIIGIYEAQSRSRDTKLGAVPLAVPCMKECSCTGCPSGYGCWCRPAILGGEQCCQCDCSEHAPLPQSCTCRVADKE